MENTIVVNGKEYVNGKKYTLNEDGTFVCEDGRVLYYVCSPKEKAEWEKYYRALDRLDVNFIESQARDKYYTYMKEVIRLLGKAVIVDGNYYLDRDDADFVNELARESERYLNFKLEEAEARKKSNEEYHLKLQQQMEEDRKNHPFAPRYNFFTRFLWRIISLSIIALVGFLTYKILLGLTGLLAGLVMVLIGLILRLKIDKKMSIDNWPGVLIPMVMIILSIVLGYFTYINLSGFKGVIAGIVVLVVTGTIGNFLCVKLNCDVDVETLFTGF